MNSENHQKVTDEHLKRDAYLYVRQSTLRQVLENTESTQRQYALRQRAVALGWPTERVIVIDNDLGLSGASAADREGFQKLVSEVSLGRAGIVLGLEVSRLARNCSDWHRLLEICALTGTLILDEDGLYDPTGFNDRLVLGLKGTMSEAELHVLRARLRGGIESKARRGELKSPLPVGFAYDTQNRVVLDPDRQVQESLRSFFQVYQRTGSATATVRFFREQKILFPRRLRRGPAKGELVWAPIVHSRALQILHNPRYAGAFVFGRSRTRKTLEGRETCQRLPQEQWHTLLPDSHELYRALCRDGAFADIEPALFAQLLRQLAAVDIVEQTSEGPLILGLKGEQLRKDRGFYAVFKTTSSYTVIYNGRSIGTVDAAPEVQEHLLFAGKRWLVTDVDEERSEIHVQPAGGYKLPKFSGSGGEVHAAVRQKMREVLSTPREYAYLDPVSRAMLNEARTDAARVNIAGANFISVGVQRSAVMTWTGTRIHQTLQAMLACAGHSVEDEVVALVLPCSEAEVTKVLRLLVETRFAPDDLARTLIDRRRRKYDEYLDDELLDIALVRGWLDQAGAIELVRTVLG